MLCLFLFPTWFFLFGEFSLSRAHHPPVGFYFLTNLSCSPDFRRQSSKKDKDFFFFFFLNGPIFILLKENFSPLLSSHISRAYKHFANNNKLHLCITIFFLLYNNIKKSILLYTLIYYVIFKF